MKGHFPFGESLKERCAVLRHDMDMMSSFQKAELVGTEWTTYGNKVALISNASVPVVTCLDFQPKLVEH